MNVKFSIHTKNNNNFDPKTVQISEIDIKDIAHALSHLCRYAGHCRKFYSVAEHSVLVYKIVKELYPDDLDAQWAALLHDATEAYVGDVPTPLKVLLPKYGEIEDELEKVISKYFKTKMGKRIHSKVKDGDILALATEAPRLFDDTSEWSKIKGLDQKPKHLHKNFPLEPEAARKYFIKTYNKVKKEVEAKYDKR